MEPLFSAVSTSAKQLWQLLRCIGFNNKAQVLITRQGIRFTVEESQVMQGMNDSRSLQTVLTSIQVSFF